VRRRARGDARRPRGGGARSARARARTCDHVAGAAAEAGFYEHKNRGFAASTGEIIVFLDGDTEPSEGWLAALTSPIARGEALVVAGFRGIPARWPSSATSSTSRTSPARRRRPSGTSGRTTSRSRATCFAAHPFPAIAPMFHGQCQVARAPAAGGGHRDRERAARQGHARLAGLGARLARGPAAPRRRYRVRSCPTSPTPTRRARARSSAGSAPCPRSRC